jgi:hypothetical protein
MAGVIRLTPAAAMVVLAGDDAVVVARIESRELLKSVGCSKFEKSLLSGDGCDM